MATSKQSRKVLSEEEYTSNLSMIIQRDYYPSLTDLQSQSAVLEKRIRGDIPGAVEIRRAARRLANHEEILAEMEEEAEHDLDDGIRKKPRPLHQESLTGFHQRVTNEDDHEFNTQQKIEVKTNRERLEKLFRPQQEMKLIEMSDSAADQFQADSNDPIFKPPKVRNEFFFPPTPLIEGGKEEEAPIHHQRLLTNDSGKDSTALSLSMPPPPPIKEGMHKAPVVSKHALVEYVPKHTLEKKIEPSQTRFPTRIVPYKHNQALLDSSSRQYSDTSDDYTTDASTDLDAPVRTIQEERRRRMNKTAKDRQSYVAMTPLIVPGGRNNSPLMTWGTVDSTPLILSGSDKQEDLIDEDARERAARKAEEELQRRAKRAKAGKGRGRDKQSGSLTPAAMSLFEKHKLIPSRQRDAFASALRGSYTPKPRSKSERKASTKRSSDHAFNATPLATKRNK